MRVSRHAGFSLVEVLFSVSILALGIIMVFQMNAMSVAQVSQTRYRSIARLAAITAREQLERQPFRRIDALNLSTTSTSQTWFMRGNGTGGSGFPIAWNSNGSAFAFPNLMVGMTGDVAGTPLTLTTTATPSVTKAGAPSTLPANYLTSTTAIPYAATVDGVTGCICVEFPVLPLKPPQGRAWPGRITLYLSEFGQVANNTAATAPVAGFPFAPSPGLAWLDCDGCATGTTPRTLTSNPPPGANGASGTASDLRTGFTNATPTGTAAAPYWPLVIPIKISVDWIPTSGGSNQSTFTDSYTSCFLLTYHGFDSPN